MLKAISLQLKGAEKVKIIWDMRFQDSILSNIHFLKIWFGFPLSCLPDIGQNLWGEGGQKCNIYHSFFGGGIDIYLEIPNFWQFCWLWEVTCFSYLLQMSPKIWCLVCFPNEKWPLQPNMRKNPNSSSNSVLG